MDFGKAFTFPFEDQDWLKKLGIAALILIIPILGTIVVAGWMLELMRRVINRDPQPLPDWNDFGGYVMKGLQALVVGLVYSLPMILVSACQQVITMGLANQNSGDDAAAMAGAGIAVCLGCFSLIYGLFLGVVLPAAFGQLAATGQIGSAFRIGEVFGLVRAAPGAYIMVLLGTILAGIIGSLGLILCIVGALATYAYAMAVQGHLYGQAYNVATQGRGGAAVY